MTTTRYNIWLVALWLFAAAVVLSEKSCWEELSGGLIEEGYEDDTGYHKGKPPRGEGRE